MNRLLQRALVVGCLSLGMGIVTAQDTEPAKAPTLKKTSVASSATNTATILKELNPHREELYRFHLALTGNAMAAQDLQIAALERALVRYGYWHFDAPPLRDWLLREAASAWLDAQGASGADLSLPPQLELKSEPAALTKEDVGRLAALKPMERVVAALVDLHGVRASWAAATLGCSEARLKSTLHLARVKARSNEVSTQSTSRSYSASHKDLVAKVAKACKDRSAEALQSLVGGESELDIPGALGAYGKDAGDIVWTVTFKDPALKDAKVITYRGEPMVGLFYQKEKDDPLKLGDILRVWGNDKGLTKLRSYYFCPHAMKEVARELKLEVQSNGYEH